MPVTVRDVAKRLKLSITTISRALDGYDDVAEQTRERVIRVAREMDYAPARAAFRLRPGAGESFAWLYTTDFYRNTPLVAYFRLKVNDNTSNGEVARLLVKGGGIEQGLRSLKGTDFSAANVYQDFRVPFTFFDTRDAFLIFQIRRSGQADVSVDGVTVFSAPPPVTAPFTWRRRAAKSSARPIGRGGPGSTAFRSPRSCISGTTWRRSSRSKGSWPRSKPSSTA